jgi:Raf kinase inhibitor-like YbhB/YbcL family protein
MSEPTPAWLASAIPEAGPNCGTLAIARLADEKLLGRGKFELHSAAFANGMALDPSFTAEEEDAVAPPLEWSAPPPGAQEIVLIVEDPEGAGDKPLCHWLVWGLPGQRGQILEGEVPQRVGKNGRGNSDWLLPAPAEDDGRHAFVFQLFALDMPLTLMPGASQEDLEAQMRGHITAASVICATYKATAEEDWIEQEPFEAGD